MVSSEDVINIVRALTKNGIQFWLVGGWGIDALLGIHTRPHKDLDLIMLVDDVARMCAFLMDEGFELKEIWSENLWTKDRQGRLILTGFVLKDTVGRELDFHALRLDERGNGIPAWEVEEGFTFTSEDLGGKGAVAGISVRCITAEKQMLCHTGYPLPEKQVPDLEQLQVKFGVHLPNGYSLLGSVARSD